MGPGMFDGCIPALFVGAALILLFGIGIGFILRGC